MTNGKWSYIAQRMTGDGAFGQFLDFNLPLQGVNLDEILSGDNGLQGQISPEVMRLKGPDGLPILSEWGSAIWAEDPDGEIRGGGILTYSTFTGPNWDIECTDLSVLLNGLPYTHSDWFVNVDPMDMFRWIWRYAQDGNGNLGVSVDPTTSPIRIGTDLVQRVEFDLEPDPTEPTLEPMPTAPNRFATNSDWRDKGVKVMSAVGWTASVVDAALGKWLNKDRLIEKGEWPKGGLTDRETTIKKKTIEKIGLPPNPPSGTVQAPVPMQTAPDATVVTDTTDQATYQDAAFKLNWYTTHDLSSVVDDLASTAPFDWSMTHRWEGDELRHHIRLGYPRLGRRRTDLRFVIGENIKVIPSIERDGMEYANEVLFLGAGEGSAQIMARAFRREDNRIRRVVVISDPSVQDQPTAALRARQELAKRFNVNDVTDIVLHDHPHARVGEVDLGDEILIEGETGWADLEVWARVISRKISPDNGDAMSLTVIRSDRLD